MRKFKDISEFELDAKIDETFYYYLLADIFDASDTKEEQIEAIKRAKDNWEKRDTQTNLIKDTILRNIEPEESYEDFEDILFETVESFI